MAATFDIGYYRTMTTLRASSITAIVSTFLAFSSPQGSFADGRGDWDGYAWQTIAVEDCRAVDTTLVCPPYQQKWDWKRDQWVGVSLTFDLTVNTLHLNQRLADQDSHDNDHVCVTALVVDATGRDIIAHHQNWRMLHRTVVQNNFVYSSPRLADAVNVYIGSKQCREGASQDDDVYAQVLAEIDS